MNKTLLCAALASVIAAGSVSAQAADKNAGKEKCYGIAKAGKNDCKTASGSHSCAGHATKDNDPNEWNFVKAGECIKMGGSTDDAGEMMMMKKQ